MITFFRNFLGRFPRLRSREFYVETFDFQSGLGDSAWLLYGLARSLKPKVCVETGSARGKSACTVGLALRRNGFGKLYAIDPHSPTSWNDTKSVDSFAVITEHLQKAGATDYVEIVRKTSVEAAKDWDKKIDLIFIDGDHSYEGVKTDWELFLPHLSEFGVVVFHDTIWDLKPDKRIARADMGVPQFVDELRAAGYPVITIDQNFGVSLVQPKIGGVKLR
ncbi:MAG TPA: CmcI family methyltransferase [Candidatus Sulfotelmatobacter sp.]|jgi:predicted O-methyltransferase YrrM|nr:CmcI family methyltransferase [Candidatus Sulfotelmatobacter sp.]